MSQNKLETYQSRLRQYQRREHMTIWVGAGLAGLIAITTGDAFNEAPAWLKALEVTFILTSGLLLASARVKFEWEATLIERKIKDGVVGETDFLPQEMKEWPQEAEECWLASLSFLSWAGVTMLGCFWWPVFAGSS